MTPQALALQARNLIVKMHHQAQSSHIGSALSCVDILAVLYTQILRINPCKPDDQRRDRFILSKGHAVSALYAVLSLCGFCKKDILKKYYCDGGILPGHATRGSLAGIEFSSGSLGHGLSVACGVCLGAKTDCLPSRCFVLMSDGECDEGSVWEAALFANQHKLDNLIAVVDRNKLQAFGRTEQVLSLEPFRKKWETFGWAVKEVNGHDHTQLRNVLQKAPFVKNKPSLIIAHTIKGKGVAFMQDAMEWHYKSTKPDEFNSALSDLQKI